MADPKITLPKEALIAQIKRDLNTLPPCELSYYLSVLMGSIHLEKNSLQTQTLLEDIHEFIGKLRAFNEAAQTPETEFTPEEQAQLDTANKELFDSLNKLIDHSRMQALPHKLKRIWYGVCSAATFIVTGILFGVVGMVGGFFSHINVINNIRGAYLGFAMGVIVGLHVSLRAPHKVFASKFEDRLEFCINSLEKVGKEQLSKQKSYSAYAEETKEYIKTAFFHHLTAYEQEIALQKFMSEPHKFQVCTSNAGFISPFLRGDFGQHSLIRFKVSHGGTNQYSTMEFNPDLGKYGNIAPNTWTLNQFEDEREVDGETFFKMMVLDRILNETHAFSVGFILKHYSVGSNDCLTYINKILVATGQAPSQISQFSKETETWRSTAFIAPTMRFFSITNGSELAQFDDKVKRGVKVQPFCKISKERQAEILAEEAGMKPKAPEAETPAAPTMTAAAAA